MEGRVGSVRLKIVLSAGLLGAGIGGMACSSRAARPDNVDAVPITSSTAGPIGTGGTAALGSARPLEKFMANGLRWLIEAQHQDGGWGGGSGAAQHIRDPHAVT